MEICIPHEIYICISNILYSQKRYDTIWCLGFTSLEVRRYIVHAGLWKKAAKLALSTTVEYNEYELFTWFSEYITPENWKKICISPLIYFCPRLLEKFDYNNFEKVVYIPKQLSMDIPSETMYAFIGSSPHIDDFITYIKKNGMDASVRVISTAIKYNYVENILWLLNNKLLTKKRIIREYSYELQCASADIKRCILSKFDNNDKIDILQSLILFGMPLYFLEEYIEKGIDVGLHTMALTYKNYRGRKSRDFCHKYNLSIPEPSYKDLIPHLFDSDLYRSRFDLEELDMILSHPMIDKLQLFNSVSLDITKLYLYNFGKSKVDMKIQVGITFFIFLFLKDRKNIGFITNNKQLINDFHLNPIYVISILSLYNIHLDELFLTGEMRFKVIKMLKRQLCDKDSLYVSKIWYDVMNVAHPDIYDKKWDWWFKLGKEFSLC